MTVINFDSDGIWDIWRQAGPSIHCPDHIKNIVITEYRIEWLDMSRPESNSYVKNHMVSMVLFETPCAVGGKIYKSARISMECNLATSEQDSVPGVPKSPV